MNAITLHAPHDVRHETVPDPRVEGPAEVLVRVERTAICGSDLHVFHGRERGLDPGTVLGHELCGRVVEVGSDVRSLAIDDRVVCPFTTSCGACFFCRRGLTARCTNGRLLGWVEQGRGLQGAQAELVRIPLADATLVRVPPGLAPDLALLAGDVLGTGLFASELGGVGAGDTVAVVGAGTVGLMAGVGALTAGAALVVAVDPLPERRAMATSFGFGVAAPAEAPDVLRSETDGRGADVVLEAVGSPAATRLAFELARPGATVAAVGVHTEPHLAIAPGELYDKNLTYRAGRSSARRFVEPALELLTEARYPFGTILTHRLPLSEGPAAYELFAERRDGCLKVVLVPGGAGD